MWQNQLRYSTTVVVVRMEIPKKAIPQQQHQPQCQSQSPLKTATPADYYPALVARTPATLSFNTSIPNQGAKNTRKKIAQLVLDQKKS
jgi:hypothetical protein